MKKLLLVGALVLSMAMPTMAGTVYLNGEPVKGDMYNKQGSTMVNLRELVTQAGFLIDYNPKAKTINALYSDSKFDYSFELKIGSKVAEAGGKTYIMQQPAEIRNGKTYVPLRFMCEAIGMNVTYKADNSYSVIDPGKTVYHNDVNPVPENKSRFIDDDLIPQMPISNIDSERDLDGISDYEQ